MGLIGRLARGLGFHRAVRYSLAYDWFARVFHRPHARSLANDRRFYRDLFEGRGFQRVFDLGANVGDKTRVFSELVKSVVSVEPDPELAEILRFRFRNRPGVVVVNVAVGEQAGTGILHRKRFTGYNTLSEKWSTHAVTLNVEERDAFEVPIATLDDLSAAHGPPDYIKIDVEGFELPVVRGCSVAPRIVSFEANLPVLRDETLLVIQRLTDLDPSYRFNARHGDDQEFLLPSPVDREGITRFVAAEGTVTHDLFAIRID